MSGIGELVVLASDKLFSELRVPRLGPCLTYSNDLLESELAHLSSILRFGQKHDDPLAGDCVRGSADSMSASEAATQI